MRTSDGQWTVILFIATAGVWLCDPLSRRCLPGGCLAQGNSVSRLLEFAQSGGVFKKLVRFVIDFPAGIAHGMLSKFWIKQLRDCFWGWNLDNNNWLPWSEFLLRVYLSLVWPPSAECLWVLAMIICGVKWPDGECRIVKAESKQNLKNQIQASAMFLEGDKIQVRWKCGTLDMFVCLDDPNLDLSGETAEINISRAPRDIVYSQEGEGGSLHRVQDGNLVRDITNSSVASGSSWPIEYLAPDLPCTGGLMNPVVPLDSNAIRTIVSTVFEHVSQLIKAI